MQRFRKLLPTLYKIGWTNKCGRPIYKAHYSTEIKTEIPIPTLALEREYSNKISALVDEISSLTLLEVKDLNDLLKKKLNISEVQAVTAAPIASSAETSEEVEEVVQQDFTIKLMDFNKPDKIKLIKSMKSILPELNLSKAKSFVETLPQIVKKDISKEEVTELKNKLEEAGGIVVVE